MSKVGKFILNNAALRMAVPPFFLFTKDGKVSKVDSGEYDSSELLTETLPDVAVANAQGVMMSFPLYAKWGSMNDYWKFPCEPMVGVNGSNVIATRNTKKGGSKIDAVKGSVKERWTQDDYSLTIEGLMQGSDGQYPNEDVKRLRKMCECGYVELVSPMCELFGIYRIVIESWNIPFTSGMTNQNFYITAKSDNDYKLLLSKDEWNMTIG